MLHNHMTLHRLSWQGIICAGGWLLSELLCQLVVAGGAWQPLVPDLITQLKHLLMARQGQSPTLHAEVELDRDLPLETVCDHSELPQRWLAPLTTALLVPFMCRWRLLPPRHPSAL